MTGARGSRAWPVVRLVALAGAVAGLIAAAPAVSGRLEVSGLVTGTAESAVARALPDPGVLTPQSTWVERAVLACPGPDRATEDGQDLQVAVAAPELGLLDPGSDLDPDTGEVSLRETGAEAAAPLVPLAGRPTEPWRTPLDAPPAAGVLVEGAGAAAPGLGAVQVEAVRARQGRGISLVPCAAGAPEQWLVAGDTGEGRAESLVLVNPGEGPVTVTVDVLGADGPVETGSAGTVVIAPHDRTVLVLDALAPGVEQPAVRVRTEDGAVSAFLADRWLDGARDRGQEVVGATTPPATDLLLPGIPVTGEVALRVAVPGSRAAVVEVSAITPEGPRALDTRTLAAAGERTTQIDLADLPAEAVALRLTSDEPVVAAAQVTHEPDEVTDGVPGQAGELGWVRAAEPLTGPAGLALAPPELGLRAALVLSARPGAEDADPGESTVRVRTRAADGTESAEDVTLAPGSGVRLDLADATEAWVDPGDDAGVSAAVLLLADASAGPLLAVSPLATAPVERTGAAVRPLPE